MFYVPPITTSTLPINTLNNYLIINADILSPRGFWEQRTQIEVLYFLSFLNRKNSIIINVFMNREDFHRYINIIDTTYVNNKKKSINNKRPYTWRVTYIACTITNTSKRKNKNDYMLFRPAKSILLFRLTSLIFSQESD